MDNLIRIFLDRANAYANDKAVMIDGKEMDLHCVEPIPRSDEMPITFIDGGSLEILSSPSMSLSFCRLCAVGYYKGKRKSLVRKGFFMLVYFENGIFESKFSGLDINLPESPISSRDPGLMFGFENVEIDAVSNLQRRLAEINFAGSLCKDGTIIAIDGSLEPKTELERSAIRRLYSIASETGTAICGISKTNSLLSYSGDSMFAAAERSLEGTTGCIRW